MQRLQIEELTKALTNALAGDKKRRREETVEEHEEPTGDSHMRVCC